MAAPVALASGPNRTIVSKPLTIEATSQDSKKVKCPAGTDVTGAAFVRYITGDNFDGQFKVDSLIPTKDDVTLVASNFQGTEVDAEVDAVCTKGGKISTKTKATTTAGEQIYSAVAKCPRGSSVTGGGAVTNSGYAEEWVLESRPKGRRAWKMSAFVSDSNPTGSAVAICDRKNRYSIEEKVEVDPLRRGDRRTNVEAVEANAKCPSGSFPSGGGFTMDGAPDFDSDAINGGMLQSLPQGRRGWYSFAKYYGPIPGTATLTSYAVCRKN